MQMCSSSVGHVVATTLEPLRMGHGGGDWAHLEQLGELRICLARQQSIASAMQSSLVVLLLLGRDGPWWQYT